MPEFNVLIWDYNRKQVISYNVIPYFCMEYDRCKKEDRPKTREEWREFVKRKGMYQYWARCEYEIIISQWPPRVTKDGKREAEVKIDVWQQIEMNLDVVVDILMKHKS